MLSVWVPVQGIVIYGNVEKKIGGIMRVENSQSRSFWVWESDSANFHFNKRGNFRSAAFEGVGGGEGEKRGMTR